MTKNVYTAIIAIIFVPAILTTLYGIVGNIDFYQTVVNIIGIVGVMCVMILTISTYLYVLSKIPPG